MLEELEGLHFDHIEFLSRYADKVIDFFEGSHVPPSLFIRALGRALAERPEYPEHLECMLNTAADMASGCECEDHELDLEAEEMYAE